MFSPLMQTIIEREKFNIVSANTLDDNAKGKGDVVLFVGGNWQKYVEVNDVAVILPEIIKASNGRLSALILDRESEREVQKRFLFNRFPSLVFLRDGEYLGTIQKVLDWHDYIIEINKILAGSPKTPPPFEIPDCITPKPNNLN